MTTNWWRAAVNNDVYSGTLWATTICLSSGCTVITAGNADATLKYAQTTGGALIVIAVLFSLVGIYACYLCLKSNEFLAPLLSGKKGQAAKWATLLLPASLRAALVLIAYSAMCDGVSAWFDSVLAERYATTGYKGYILWDTGSRVAVSAGTFFALYPLKFWGYMYVHLRRANTARAARATSGA